mmetsp:Transcript_142241/g.250986  ORF Transcript_142241/g.250986 Transcript_142241/m.250986 type:complete len:152 (-) Transcript_142241:168-623(-)
MAMAAPNGVFPGAFSGGGFSGGTFGAPPPPPGSLPPGGPPAAPAFKSNFVTGRSLATAFEVPATAGKAAEANTFEVPTSKRQTVRRRHEDAIEMFLNGLPSWRCGFRDAGVAGGASPERDASSSPSNARRRRREKEKDSKRGRRRSRSARR